MRSSESFAVAYFTYLGLAAIVRRLPPVRRGALLVVSAACGAAIVALAHVASEPVRDWAPAVYILVGYFASGLLAVTPSPRFEAWLSIWDRRWLTFDQAGGVTTFLAWPRWFVAYLEIIYMGCFLLIPAGLVALQWGGHRTLTNRYWLVVLASEFGAFAPLAFVEARPPWALEPKAGHLDSPAHQGVHRAVSQAASNWIQYLTIGVNTFPSGHVSGSLAVAFAVIGAMPWAGTLLLALAVSIAIACVAGRYHYIVDVVAGALLAAGAWAVASLFRL